MILQSEIETKTQHRDWLLKLAAMAEPATAENFRQQARDISKELKQAHQRAEETTQ